MDLSIIIPAYLEEENLRILLPRINDIIPELGIKAEILVIDTMAPMDNTKNVCLKNNAVYINRENGNVYGDAVRTGIKNAHGKYFIFMDADGSHSPEFIKNLYENRTDYDVIIASRYVEGGKSDNSKILIFMSWIVNLIYAVLFRLKCKDVSNSFKLYKSDQLKKLTLKCSNFDVVEEILIKLKKINKNLSIKELPYTFKERMFGHTKRNLIKFVFSYIFTLFKLKFFV